MRACSFRLRTAYVLTHRSYAPWEQRATEQKSPDNTQEEGITTGRKFETTDKMKAQVLVYPACHFIAPFDAAAPLLPMMLADVCLPMMSSWVSMLWLCSYEIYDACGINRPFSTMHH